MTTALIALTARALLLATESVSFHSDEAVVGLMARHILTGERPVFFYGQAYMGSLDAWLIAGGFALLGESVMTIRVVQSVLYLAVVAAGYWLAWRLTERPLAAIGAGLLLAVPPTLVALYTTATLGGYNETLLFGIMILLLAHSVTHQQRASRWRWALLGLAAGLGWWTNGLIIVFAVPAGLIILLDLWRGADRRATLISLGIALAGFFIGSAPWWIFAFENDLAPLRFLIGDQRGGFAGTGAIRLGMADRLIGLLLFGLPAVVGLRSPWSPEFFLLPLGVAVALIFIIAAIGLARRRDLPGYARLLLVSMLAIFCVLFLASSFSNDPTGRYFLPLIIPLSIAFGLLVDALHARAGRLAATALLGLVLAYFAAGQVYAASNNPPGITTQFNPITHIPNNYDEALIAFLIDHDLTYGYTNYWIAFRLAFLSGEQVQYSATLPDKPDLTYTPYYERYPPYRAAADGAERIGYITANVPEIEQELERLFVSAGVRFERAEIGPFVVFYDFSPAEAVPRPPLPFIVQSQ